MIYYTPRLWWNGKVYNVGYEFTSRESALEFVDEVLRDWFKWRVQIGLEQFRPGCAHGKWIVGYKLEKS
jgi:hypothetical protein